MRVKVGCLRHDQGDPAAADVVAAYTALTVRHLRAGMVRLIVVGGLPGTGKTTMSGRIADRLGAVLISSDVVRKELAGLNPNPAATAEFGQGISSRDRTEKAYAELTLRARDLLAQGETVVLDASWTSARHRAAARALAHDTHSDLVELRCTAEPATVTGRLARRAPRSSDADAAIAAAMAAVADPWPEARVIATDETPTVPYDMRWRRPVRCPTTWTSEPPGRTRETGPSPLNRTRR